MTAMLESEWLDLAFKGNIDLSTDDAKLIWQTIAQNFTSRPKFSDGELKIRGKKFDSLKVLLKNGTRIMDAIAVRNHCTGESESFFAFIEEVETKTHAEIEAQMKGLAMHTSTIIARGEYKPDDGKVMSFTSHFLPHIKTNAQLTTLLTTASTLEKFIPKNLLHGPYTGVDQAILNKLNQGPAGHKVLKLLKNHWNFFSKKFPNHPIVRTFGDVRDHHFFYLHPAYNGGALAGIFPKFTIHGIRSFYHNTSQEDIATIIEFNEITSNDADAIGLVDYDESMVTDDMCQKLLVKCFAHGEFKFNSDTEAAVIPNAMRQAVAKARSDDQVNTDKARGVFAKCN